MPKAKKVIKKVSKVTKKAKEEKLAPEFNEFGTCIACQGGNPDCLHTNLAQGPGGSLTCVTCGKCMS